MVTRFFSIGILSLSALALAACGSSGGNSAPPAPPGPVTPPPPPEPTFEERLEDLAEHDPNPCRARTSGFEALGGWLKNDGRELGGSRVWIDDVGELSETSSHGARVWGTFTDCAVRSTTEHYFVNETEFLDAIRADGGDLIQSLSNAPAWEDIELPEPGTWGDSSYAPGGILNRWHDGTHTGQRVLRIQGAGNEAGERTSHLQRATFQLALQESNTALWILVGGHAGDPDSRRLAGRNPATGTWGPSGTSICGAAEPLCLFGPWQGKDATGTSHATPQVAAALDTVWAIWPDMDILDLRNLAFDCAENMTVEGASGTERTYSYSNGRSFTSTTNTTWGHGILSLTCLFTANGGLQDPTTGEAISGGIFGPIAGPVTGASITGVDYTGRDFGYGFARPVARENFALAATANLRPVQAVYAMPGFRHNRAAVHGALWRSDAISVHLTAAGNAIGVTTQWQAGNFTLRSGLAAQPDGAGSLTGSRAFRAPSTVSAAITAAYGRALPQEFSMHLQADHWRTLSAIGRGRSLWQDAKLSESRISAALVKRVGSHEFALQGVWRSGLSGSLNVDGRPWALAPRAERGLWLTWNWK